MRNPPKPFDEMGRETNQQVRVSSLSSTLLFIVDTGLICEMIRSHRNDPFWVGIGFYNCEEKGKAPERNKHNGRKMALTFRL